MLKHLCTAMALVFLCLTTSAQKKYFQQTVSYNLFVILDEKQKNLNAWETLVYQNNSPDTLHFIWFHIWPNAYRNTKTALFQQILNDPEQTIVVDTTARPGLIEGLNFRVNGIRARTEADSAFIDIIKVLLPSPLAPGKSAIITTPFKVQLPYFFSRSGYAGNQFMICQWYPKPAVYDANGWHTMPYLALGEFYGEFGTYNVNINLPANYVVSATGQLKTTDELAIYKRIGASNYRRPATDSGQLYQAASPGRKTLWYEAKNTHDFSWFADPQLVIEYDTARFASGKTVDVFSYYRNAPNSSWRKSINFLKDGIRRYSNWIGDYPYPVVQAVEGPESASSGMEYPMITLITSSTGEKELDGILAHEAGHNWFYASLGNNERDHPWLDEGINTYFEFLYEAEKYRYNSFLGNSLPPETQSLPLDVFQDLVYNSLNENLPLESPISTATSGFASATDYFITVYAKTAIWLYKLKSEIGQPAFDAGIRDYFSTWKFKHVNRANFKASMEKASGRNLDGIFALLDFKGKIPLIAPGSIY